MHHAVNNPNGNSQALLQLLDYLWGVKSDELISCFLGVLNRAMLRKSKDLVRSLINFYKDKEIHNQLKFTEVILEASIYLNDFDIFSDIIGNYEDGLPQICLQSIIFNQNDLLLDTLLGKFSNLFEVPDLYKDIDFLPPEFTKIIDTDLLKNYKYFDQISHPIFSNKEKNKQFWKYNPLQLAVFLDNSKILKLLFQKT